MISLIRFIIVLLGVLGLLFQLLSRHDDGRDGWAGRPPAPSHFQGASSP